MLNAPNDRAFGEALLNHGPVEDPDLPAILEASTSGSAAKRRNAARALLILRGDKALEAQLRFITETHDVDAWAVILGGFRVLDRHPDWAGKRPDLIRKALASGDGETAAVGIRAGVSAHYPGIDREIDRRLDDQDIRVRSACLVSMTPAMVPRLLPRLKQMIGELLGDPPPQDQEAREALVKAFFSTGEKEIHQTIRGYYEAAAREFRLELATMFNLSSDPWLEELLWEYWQIPDKRQDDKNYLDPVQTEALDSMLWHIAEKKDLQAKPRWVRACIQVESANPPDDALNSSCVKLAHYLSGRPEKSGEWRDRALTVRLLGEWVAAHADRRE